MKPGFLVVANDVAAGAEEAFERWYQAEHLAERLGVPGFHNARRYVALDGAPRYLALYETENAAILASEPYRALLSAPTDRTRGVMPSFRNMNRTVMECGYRSARGMGVLLDLVVLDAVGPAATLPPVAELTADLSQDPAFEGVVLLSSANQQPVSQTAEGRLRNGPDASIDAAALVYWAALPDHRPRDPRQPLEAVGLKPVRSPGGRYRLLAARGRFDFR